MAKRCDSCEIICINGLRCHETGCPDAWKDEIRECRECGCDFEPQNRHQDACEGCASDSGWFDTIDQFDGYGD